MGSSSRRCFWLCCSPTSLWSMARIFSRPWIFGGLLAGLAVAYLIPFDRIPVSASVEGIIAAAVFAMPVVCAGLLFALEFQTVDSPSAALGANMLGAVAGGLMENLSLVIGMR